MMSNMRIKWSRVERSVELKAYEREVFAATNNPPLSTKITTRADRRKSICIVKIYLFFEIFLFGANRFSRWKKKKKREKTYTYT